MPEFEQFSPKGGDGPSQRFPFTFSQVVEKARASGVIPEGVTDEQIRIAVVTPDGAETLPGPSSPEHDADFYERVSRQWSEGEPLPHLSLSFDDPPGGMSPQEWRDMLTGAARECGDPDMFKFALVAAVGRDLVISHDVPVDTAMAACEQFAASLYATYHDTSA